MQENKPEQQKLPWLCCLWYHLVRKQEEGDATGHQLWPVL